MSFVFSSRKDITASDKKDDELCNNTDGDDETMEIKKSEAPTWRHNNLKIKISSKTVVPKKKT